MSDKLATAADFLEDGSDFDIYTDRKGRNLKVRPVYLDEISLQRDYKVERDIAAAGLDPNKNEDREAFGKKLLMAEEIEYQKLRLDDMRNDICKSVENINFVNKKQENCEEGEVSVHKITPEDLRDMSAVIRDLSNPESSDSEPSSTETSKADTSEETVENETEG